MESTVKGRREGKKGREGRKDGRKGKTPLEEKGWGEERDQP